MASKLFEYVVYKQEEKNKDGKVVDEAVVLVPVSSVLAKDETQVQLLAARAIPEQEIENLDRIQVVVRPF